ncbi:hypothetical protein EI94DRAFT_1835468 [Lactarius quietus]|nr:hypothetical protein EI94DRAFT_1835468 [Lactarius quietus]
MVLLLPHVAEPIFLSPQKPQFSTSLLPSASLVSPRGFTSTSTTSLNYPPSYSSNAIRRSSTDQRSSSPPVPRASSQTYSLPIFSHDAPDKRLDIVALACGPSNPIHREAVRAANSVFCLEMLKPGQNASLEEEYRMRSLARLERGEERERRMFTEVLRVGYVLFQLISKLRLGSIAQIDPREEGEPRTSNVTKVIASCSTNGLPPKDLFRETISSRARPTASHAWQRLSLLLSSGQRPPYQHAHLSCVEEEPAPGLPYRTGSSLRAVMSLPNLSAALSAQPSHPTISPTRSTSKQRPPPPAGLPTVRSHSPDTASSNDVETSLGTDTESCNTPTTATKCLRSSRPSARMSIAKSTTGQSIASSNMTDTSTHSSLLGASIGLVFGGGRSGSGSGPYGKFSKKRTVTTELKSLTVRPRERKPSETAPVDLLRVVEESERRPALLARGRFQSEVVDANSRRRPGPKSYDEFGAMPRRSRFESMILLAFEISHHLFFQLSITLPTTSTDYPSYTLYKLTASSTFTGIQTASVIFAGANVLLSVAIVLDHPHSNWSDAEFTQAANGLSQL